MDLFASFDKYLWNPWRLLGYGWRDDRSAGAVRELSNKCRELNGNIWRVPHLVFWQFKAFRPIPATRQKCDRVFARNHQRGIKGDNQINVEKFSYVCR